MKNLLFLSFLSLFLFSCGPSYVYEKEHELPEEGWSWSDTLSYTLNITDTLSRYNLLLELEHSRRFPFRNIYLQIHTTYPSGKSVHDRLSIDLMDSKGLWYGKCGKEDCTLLISLQEGLYFDQMGPHTLAIEQYMRKDPLPGIQSAGLLLEKVKQ